MVEVPDFDDLYRRDRDPWRVATSFYEQRKLDVVLASLTRATYRAAWDPACGTGELSARLASRAGTVLATDTSAEAVRLAAGRCSGLPTVRLGRLRQPAVPPDGAGAFDLIVVAEFAYYLPAVQRAAMWTALSASAAGTAEIVVVHWRHRPHDGYLSGADVNSEATVALTGDGFVSVVRHDDRDFVVDVLVRESS